MRSLFTVMACVSVAIAGAQAQESTPPQPTAQPEQPAYSLKLKSQVVVLDVVVTDKQGNVVRNLPKDAFQVFEDKVPQAIRTLDQIGTEAPKTAVKVDSTAELDRLEPNAPVSIIVLGESSTEFKDQAFARYSLKEYLKTQGDTLPQPMMLVAVDATHFMVLRDYTTSKAEILKALDHHFANPPWAPMGGGRTYGFSTWLKSLEVVSQATAGHPGHKNMIWVGRGFRGVSPRTMPEAGAQIKQEVALAVNMLRDSRVTLYAIDPAGVGADTINNIAIEDENMPGDPFDDMVDFDRMTQATGGRLFKNRNDVDALIGTSMRDGLNFYTLTYTPAVQTDDKQPFRKIKVVMKDHNLKAIAREGYFTKTADVAPVTTPKGDLSKRLVGDLNLASQSLMVYDGMPMDIARDAAAPDKFILHLKVPNLPPTVGDDGKQVPDLAFLVESFDVKGKKLSRNAAMIALHSTGAGAGRGADGGVPTRPVDYPVTVATAAPVARIRFIVRDNATGKMAADNVFLVDRKLLKDRTTGLDPEKAPRISGQGGRL